MSIAKMSCSDTAGSDDRLVDTFSAPPPAMSSEMSWLATLVRARMSNVGSMD